MAAPLALIAGTGHLPMILVERLEAEGRPYLLAEPEGFAMDGRGTRPVQRFRLERLALFFDHLHKLGVRQVVFAGAVHRPKLEPELFDPRTAQLVPRMVAALEAGDDAALRAVVELFEEDELQVIGVQDVVPELLPEAGILTRAAPSARDKADAARAAAVVAALGAADVGQGAVVQQGQVLAVEALPGTDWMLARLADAPFAARPQTAGGRGVFCKAPKPGQDRRMDLPTIGPATIAAVARAGLAGLVIEAGGVLVLERETVLAEADAAGLFLWVQEAG